jgi:hypothetical protein
MPPAEYVATIAVAGGENRRGDALGQDRSGRNQQQTK